MKTFLLTILLFLPVTVFAKLPAGFSYCTDVIPNLTVDLHYISNNNFTGKPVDGYIKPVCILSTSALNQLAKVQKQLKPFDLGLKVYDAYRPQRAVDNFVRWQKTPDHPEIKKHYYPNLNKADLFKLDFIATKSGHTRGSTVDLTIIDLHTKQELDMGGHFDYFGERSKPFYQGISMQQKANRALLRHMMIEQGFMPNKNEWWHFNLSNEPFPNTYWDFPVK
ncbi:M15 family metallopeptidase [Parashewanella tropica]|uniref:M15 family metallopeptidase n=1 Tax=Parashewanella tropica TaxID=2547970 RepID=UPI001059FC8F|nr:M15 family metallopeptidase [Parashewanella tropica]